MFCTQTHFVLEDKEIAVKIRSNSHYRNSGFNRSSRNACQSVTHKSLLGSSGRCVPEFGAFVPMRYGRMPFDSQYPWRVLLFYPFEKKNGIVADYNVDQSYWAFLINGEYASTGVDGASITEGETYCLVYTK